MSLIDENQTKEWKYPIQHFTVEDSKNVEVEFDKGVVVKNLNVHKDNLNVPQYAIVVNEIFKNSVVLASRVITSFRLEKEGRIGYDTLLNDNTELPLSKEDVYGLPSRTPKNTNDNYSITSMKLPDVVDRYQQISTFIETEDNQPYSIIILALSRFNRTYDEAYMEDILIDLMICFEILFTYIGEEDKKQKLASRCTKLLKSRNDVSHDRIIPVLVDAYSVRTKIVHQGMRYLNALNETNKIHQPLKFIYEVKNYARFSLQEYVKRLVKNHPQKSNVLKKSIKSRNFT